MGLISSENMLLEAVPEVPHVRLGGQPAKGHINMLNFRNYVTDVTDVPAVYSYWAKRKAFPFYETGNNDYACCTRAKQSVMQMMMERQEQRRTKVIGKDEILRVYEEMSDRLYGGGDNGAYEIDALNSWRNKDYTFRDNRGRPMTIDGYAKINHSDIQEVKKALYISGSRSIAVCFGMPFAWAGNADMIWDIVEGQQAIGNYQIGSWGYHSMTAIAEYDEWGVTLPSTWNLPNGKISWRAFAMYASEAYIVIDSFNQWKSKLQSKGLNADKMISDINNVSDIKIR